MRTKISLKNMLLFIIFLTLNIIILLLSKHFMTNSNISGLTYMAIVQTIINLVILIMVTGEIISLSTIFLMLCFIFFYGQLIVYSFHVEVFEGISAFRISSITTIVSAVQFELNSTFFIALGIMIKKLFGKDKIYIKNIKKKKYLSSKVIYQIGIALFLIGIGPKLYIDFNRLIKYAAYRYSAGTLAITYGFLGTFSNIAEYGILMVLISKYKSKRYCKILSVISILYQIIPIMCGVRARSVIFIITIIFFYEKIYKSINWKKAVLLVLSGYFFIIISNVISQSRQDGITYNILVNSFKFNAQNSQVLTLIQELGNTLCSVCYSIEFFPNSPVNFYSRFNMLPRLLTVFPNIGDLFSNFKNIFYVNTNFPIDKAFSTSLGGSFLCELYFDQGQYGYIFAIFIGLFVEHISKLTNYEIKSEKISSLPYLLPLFTNTIWWIRDNFISLPRDFIWTSILIVVLYKFFRVKKYNTIKNNFKRGTFDE